MMQAKNKQILALLLSITLVCATLAVFAQPTEAAAAVEQSRELVASTNTLEMYLVKTDYPNAPNIAIRDKRTNEEWRSWVSETDIDLTKMNKSWNSKLRSIFLLNYVVFSEKKGVATQISSADATEVNVTKITDGLRFDYKFDSGTVIGIEVSFDITLEGDSVNVNIPFKRIKESNICGIVSIDMLPFFGATSSSVPGYIFYPDGSGALLYNDSLASVDKQNTYSWSVYGQHQVDMEVYEQDEVNNLKTAMLPVFGIKRGNSAFLSILTKGEADANINLSPNGYIMSLARISPEFIYRRFYKTPRQDGKIVMRNEKDIIPEDHAIKYIMLANENADYSGMAGSYRDYLIKNGLCRDVLSLKEQMPFGLELFMGIKEQRLLFDKYIAMTTFKQAKEIVQSFLNSGINNIQVSINGWTKGGWGEYPENLTPERKLGGKRGLEDFANFINENNQTLFLRTNLVDAYKSNGGFSTRNDVVYTNSQMLVTDDKSESYILNPQVIKDNLFNRLYKNIGKAKIAGFVFDKIGRLLYNDYNKRAPVNREQTQQIWSDILQWSVSNYGNAAVDGGNAYVFKYADRLFNIPIEDSGYFITDEQVPFFSMVVHGLIPYSTEPANLFYDSVKQKLEWVEYGCIPYYELTYRESNLLKYTNYNKLFTSYYKDWIEPATEIYKEFSTKLSGTWKAKMIKHERLSPNVAKVTYDNGDTVYVNYGQEDFTVGDLTVKAQDYLVVDKGGNVR